MARPKVAEREQLKNNEVKVYLTDAQMAWLRREAALNGSTLAQIVRTLITRKMNIIED